ncbi:MAG: adenylate cyclase [Ferruginibacter sp.]|nr:adenylate cyclase [Ferruginibacter sp.]
MYKLHFNGERSVNIMRGQSILEVAQSAGIPLLHNCGGNAKCSTCRVLILDGEESLSSPNQKELALNAQMQFPAHVRLACQTTFIGTSASVKRIIRDKTDMDIYIGDDIVNQEDIGDERELSLFFLDIRNFTAFVETNLAFDVIHIVRKIFLGAQKIIQSRGGTVIETMGDGFYAVFGCENSVGESVNGAIDAGFKILEELELLNASYFMPHFNQQFEVGIGVHFGIVASGEIKFGNQSHRIIMGLPVNVAARLQNATKELNNNFIISAAAYEHVNHSQTTARTTLQLKGVSEPIEVVLLGNKYHLN